MKKLMQSIILGIVCCCMVMPHAFAQAPEGLGKGTELIVGSTTPMSGHFGTDLWGDNTTDMDVRLLLHGYAIVEKDKTPGTKPHAMAVESLDVREEADGSRIYTVTLAGGLAYSDGTPISAKDYVFAYLLCASPELKAIGGTPEPMDHIRGYSAFQAGSSKAFAGVRLLSDSQFSVQVEAGFTPYFYELTLLAVVPYPISVIAPGCEVVDTENGATIQGAQDASGIAATKYTPGVFSADMLRETMLNESTGYEFFPKVTSGPYQLESYDASGKTATFVANPHYAGNHEGQKPHIERIVLTQVSKDTMFDALAQGNIHLINKIAGRDALTKAQEIVTNDGTLTGMPYLRSGLVALPFACETGVTASPTVRKAIAMSLDKDALAAEMMGGMAVRAYGYYGVGQWMVMYSDFQGEDGSQSVLDALQKLDIPVNVEAANKMLDADGWTLDAQGGTYSQGLRYKKDENGMTPLIIKWVRPTENSAGDIVEKALHDGLGAIGAELDVTVMPFADMLKYYYREYDRHFDMFLLATDFGYVFDPYYDFHTGEMYQGSTNKTGLKDEQLMQLAREMRTTSPDDLAGYMDTWMAFQERFSEVLPMIPLYSGIYMDVATNALQGYDILGYSSWALAIPYAWMEG